jgi:3',5'-cyclic-nucleotide phosphodiesterase
MEAGPLGTWDFNIFLFVEKNPGVSVLMTVVESTLQMHGLGSILGLHRQAFGSFISAISQCYQKVPYHNIMHAADVVQGVGCLLTLIPETILSPFEKLALVVSAAVHDLNHPGQNNAFQVATKSPLAITYNDRSVLENFHVSFAFSMLKGNLDFLGAFGEKLQREMRKLVILLVLATDMAEHLNILSLFNMKIKNGFDDSNVNDRYLLLSILLKMADIGNIMRPSKLYLQWTAMLEEEFFQQGDMEKQRGLPVSPFMDRYQFMRARSQAGFFEFISFPLVTSFVRFCGKKAEFLFHNMEANKALVISSSASS